MWKAYTTSGNSLDPELRIALGSACADDSCHDGGEGYAQRHLQQSDYYDQNRTVEGKWHGRGAELLGLKGEVTSEDFEAVRQSLDPQTGERHGADRIASNGDTQRVRDLDAGNLSGGRPRKSESLVTSAGTRSGTRTRRSSKGTAKT